MIDNLVRVVCDGCYYQDEYPAKEARAQAAEEGWRLDTEAGDLCSACANGREETAREGGG